MNTPFAAKREPVPNLTFLTPDGASVELASSFATEHLLLIFMRHLA